MLSSITSEKKQRSFAISFKWSVKFAWMSTTLLCIIWVTDILCYPLFSRQNHDTIISNNWWSFFLWKSSSFFNTLLWGWIFSTPASCTHFLHLENRLMLALYILYPPISTNTGVSNEFLYSSLLQHWKPEFKSVIVWIKAMNRIFNAKYREEY